MKIVRHPFEITWIIHSKKGLFVRLGLVDMGVNFGMSGRMKSLLEEFTACNHCHKVCSDIYEHFSCVGSCANYFVNEVQVTARDDLELIFPNDKKDLFLDTERYEKSCRSSFHRKVRLNRAVGSFTEKSVRELLNVQKGHCYYCYASLYTPDGSRDEFQRDHYVAIASGGRNHISNIVLACPTCNGQKNNMHGDLFVLHAGKGRAKEVQADLRQLHIDVKNWRRMILQQLSK